MYIDQSVVIDDMVCFLHDMAEKLDAIEKCIELVDGKYSNPELAFYEIKNLMEETE